MSAAQGSGPGSYVQRAINVTISLGEGSFGQTGANSVKLQGLRVVATIEKAGYPSFDKANIRVYGVQPAIMNQISTLGVPTLMIRKRNSVLIEAGDAINGMATCYSGYIQNAWQAFEESPETSLNVVGSGGQDQAIIPVAPLSQPTSFDAATALSGIANNMGWKFENSGVSVQLPASYFPGTALEQCHSIARAGNFELYADTGTNPITLAIWPKTGTRGGQIPLISAQTGLIQYPKFQSSGMSFKCLFNPNLRVGGMINMQSSVGGAPTTAGPGQKVPAGTQSGGPNGLWYVTGPLVYDLASQLPGGPWFNEVQTVRVNPGYAQPATTPPPPSA